jgi:hypothetical protein
MTKEERGKLITNKPEKKKKNNPNYNYKPKQQKKVK